MRLLKAFGAEVIVTPTAVPPDHPDNYVMMAKRIAHETPNAILANQFYNDANSAGALRDDRPGDLGADRGTHHALRLRRGNGRHDHRRRALPEGEESEDPDHRRRSGRLDPRRDVAHARARASRRARRTRSKGSGRTRFRARSTCRVDRRLHDGERQGVVRDGAPPHARGRTVRRRLERADRARRAAGRAADRRSRTRCVVTLLPDTGERYLSKLYNDEWMRENQLLDAGSHDARRSCSSTKRATTATRRSS